MIREVCRIVDMLSRNKFCETLAVNYDTGDMTVIKHKYNNSLVATPILMCAEEEFTAGRLSWRIIPSCSQ